MVDLIKCLCLVLICMFLYSLFPVLENANRFFILQGHLAVHKLEETGCLHLSIKPVDKIKKYSNN